MMKHRMMIGAALICTTVAAVNLAQRGDAQTGGGFAGEYGGTSDGGKAVATIRQASPGNYTIEHTIYGTRDGCGGSVRGAASASGNVMELRIPVLETMETCVMTYRRNGASLAVSEKSCGYFHGRSCAFDGALVRKAAGRSQQGASRSRTTTDEPVVGMMEDGGPAGGDLVSPQGRPNVSSLSTEWYASDDFVAVDDSSDLGLSLTVLCYGSPLKPMMGIDPTILIRGFRSPDPDAFSKRERLRLFAKTPVLTLTAFNAKGSKTAVMTFGRIMQDGKPSFFRPLSATELSLIKASSRLLVSSAQWAAVFTGRGAARQLSGVRC